MHINFAYATTLTRARISGRISSHDPSLLRGDDLEAFYANRKRGVKAKRKLTDEEVYQLSARGQMTGRSVKDVPEAQRNRYKGRGQ